MPDKIDTAIPRLRAFGRSLVGEARRGGARLPLAVGCLAVFAVYQYLYMALPFVPGNDAVYPAGWWGWFDQGEYMKAARAFAAGDFSPGQHYYPPFYPFLGSLFLWVSQDHAYYVPDLAFALGTYVVLVALFARHIGWWGAAAGALAGMLLLEPFRVQWVVPWTTTPGAFFIVASLFFLDRFVRLRDAPSFAPRDAGINATGFGLVVGMQALLRPADMAIVAPVALTYAFLVLRPLLSGKGASRGVALASIAGGAVSFAVPVALMLWFNHVTHGSMFGGYVKNIIAVGVNPFALPEKLFSQLVASQVFYGEQDADWLSVIPLVFAALLALPVVLFTGPVVMRAAAAAAMLQLAIYNSYTDVLPTGTFRYYNIHYFKWLAPVALCILVFVVRQAFAADAQERRRGRRGLAAGLALGLIVVSIDAVQDVRPVTAAAREGRAITLDLAAEPVDLVDLNGVGGSWPDVYFAARSSIVLDGERTLTMIKDYRFLPIENGVRVLFFEPVVAGRIRVEVGEGMTLPETVGAADVQPVHVEYALGLPFSQQASPAQPLAGYAPGGDVVFAEGGNAGPYAKGGWSDPEGWGRWIDGDEAELALTLAPRPEGDLTLTLVVTAFLVPPAHPVTTADVIVNGRLIGRIEARTGEPSQQVFRIPADAVPEEGDLRLAIRNLSPLSPQEAGTAADARRLGIGLVRMRLDSANDRPVPVGGGAS